MPGFDADANPYDHQLFLGTSLLTAETAALCVRALRIFAARQSLIRIRLNQDVLPFSSIRSAALRLEQDWQENDEGADDSDRLIAARKQIEALEDEIKRAGDWEIQLTGLFEETEARAISAEANVRGSIARIQHLQENLTQRGEKLDTTLALPAKWPDLADWCGENLIGRLVLAPAARRSVKKPAFEDVSLTARCLIWLANECRNRRIKGGGSLS